jgi:hypothetical protein
MAMIKATIVFLAFALGAYSETAILQLKVLEGEGAVNIAGTRASRPITLQVTDEIGRPVVGVAVSFRMTEEDHGFFRSGMKTEILVTGSDGRVAVWGIQWGRTTGPVRIRVTAAKDQARAGIVVSQYISDTASSAPDAQIGKGSRWKLIGLVAAGAVGAGLAAGRMGARTVQTGSATGVAAASTAAGIQIGTPSITVGKP